MTSELKTTLRRAAALMIGLVLAGAVPAIEHWVSISTRKAEAKKATEHVNTAAIDPALQPPPGRYRIATPDQLAGIRLPLTRIVISHRDAEPVYGMGFGVPDELSWRAERAYVAPRTRTEALALARRIEAELREDPSAIDRIAREHSDDRASAPFGGRVGAIASDELSVAQLDAAAPLRAGELSQLFESTYGFELLKLEQPPAPQMVSGRRAVIAYRNTLGSRESGEPARDEAFALAREIAVAVQIGSQSLLDGARARTRLNELASGSTGTWSTHDASQATMSSPLELMLLGELPMNGVSAPYDTAYGVAVLQRVPEEPQQPLGYEGVFYRFDPSAPAGPESRAGALDFAREVVREARLNPERFAELQRQHCCVEPNRIMPGLGHFALTRAVQQLEVGVIAEEPYVDAAHLVVLKRVEPPPARQLRVQAFELPKPESPDMALLIEHGDGAMLSTATRELARDAAGSLGLDLEQKSAFIELFDELATQLAGGRPGPERMNLVAAALDRARQLVGTERYGRFTAYMAEWTAQRMMNGH